MPTQGLPVIEVPTTAANAPESMKPSRVRLTTPARSASTPPAAANRYGIEMRAVCSRIESMFMVTRAP
jgi:hypothetical protein